MESALEVRPVDDSSLELQTVTLPAGSTSGVASRGGDTLLYAAAGTGSLSLHGVDYPLGNGSAALVLAGEDDAVTADDELELVVATVGGDVDLHAPMGAREVVTSLDHADSQRATGARSFQLLFGPHNGSTRATLFAGFIPPGKAPWHYHLYDEIVWVPDGPGRLHLAEGTADLGPRSAFRLRPRQVHIVENAGPGEMTIIGIFTPAGSPSAAYITADAAGEYPFAG